MEDEVEEMEEMEEAEQTAPTWSDVAPVFIREVAIEAIAAIRVAGPLALFICTAVDTGRVEPPARTTVVAVAPSAGRRCGLAVHA